MNPDGINQTRLTEDPRDNGGPVWSPDGQRIAFRSNRDGVNEIYAMNADGSDQTRLTTSTWTDRRASWQPLALPSNNFCFGKPRRNTKRGFVRQRVRVPGPGTVLVRRSERVRRFVRETEDAGWVGVLVRPRGTAKRRVERAGSGRRRMAVNLRAEIAFRPEGGQQRIDPIRVRLVRVARR